MPSLKSLVFGFGSFYVCSYVVFESDSFASTSLNRLARIGVHSNGRVCLSIQE